MVVICKFENEEHKKLVTLKFKVDSSTSATYILMILIYLSNNYLRVVTVTASYIMFKNSKFKFKNFHVMKG